MRDTNGKLMVKEDDYFVAGEGLRPEKESLSMRARLLQAAGAILVTSASFIPFTGFSDRSNAQVQESNFPDLTPKQVLQDKGVRFESVEANSADPCTGYTKIYDDQYGAEESPACLEKRYPLQINAHDYVKDATGDVVKKRKVINRNELWEEVRDPVTGLFSDKYNFVSKIPMGHVASMVSSSDGYIIFTGGEETFLSGHTALEGSFDGGKTWKQVDWKYPASGVVQNLVRFTDSNFGGNNGNYRDGAVAQFIMAVDNPPENVNIAAVAFTSPKEVNLNIGSARDFGILTTDTISHMTKFMSTGSYNMQVGLVGGEYDYITGIGTAAQITQTLINGVPENLGYMYGWANYKDVQGHNHIVTSDMDNQSLYDIDLDVIPKVGTKSSYANLCDGQIPNLINGTLWVTAIGKYSDENNNLKTVLGGAVSLTSTNVAVLVDLEAGNCIVPDLNKRSEIAQQRDMLRHQYRGKKGYELILWSMGNAFRPDGKAPVFTTRGLGVRYSVFLSVITRNYPGGW